MNGQKVTDDRGRTDGADDADRTGGQDRTEGPSPLGGATSVTVPARAPWSAVIPAGGHLTITDLHGNQAVDFLVYDAHDTAVRYSAPDTVQAQGNLFLTTGSVLLSNEHTPLMTVVADTCGRHDTIGGACSKESNTLRYGHHTWSQHACVDNFLSEGARYGLGKRDLVSNVNWYMNVPVEEDGTLGIVDGISAPGLEVELRAETDVLVLVSNCPQINNPCNGFDPTPVLMTVRTPGRAGDTVGAPSGEAVR
ncbi:urea amidolyase associated protein UAAP2 [Streptomyces sp. NPDC088197]|uniref:urea amidolyase associated protein UAAP2 n=1 Tax=Streptomyces sp. NPDC088197 TaxID=3365840 RepID=UPI003816BB5A